MKFYEIYFSPTGGTKKTADIISDVWQSEKEVIDLFSVEYPQKTHFTENDVCLIAVPSFGGRVPAAAIERLQKLNGNGAKAILVAVYGNREFEDTLVELKDTLKNAGFFCVAAISAVAEHSIFRQFAANRPDKEDQRELEQFARQIYERIPTIPKDMALHVPGNHPYRTYNGVPLKPTADKTCTKCGICARTCPVNAIPKENPASVDKEKCISCMHCISVCPEKSRKNNKILLWGASQKLKKACGGRKQNQLFLNEI